MPITLAKKCQFKINNFSGKIMNLSTTIVSYSDMADLEKTINLLNDHPEITVLKLEDCNLHDHHLPILAKKLKYIENISLRGNYITTDGLQLFLESLKENEAINLKEMDLRNSNFSVGFEKWGKIIDLFPESVVKLNLDGNRAILGEIKEKVAAKVQENIEKLQAKNTHGAVLSSSYSPGFHSSSLVNPENQKENTESQSLSSNDLNIKQAYQQINELSVTLSQFSQLPEELNGLKQQLDNLLANHSISPSLIKSQ